MSPNKKTSQEFCVFEYLYRDAGNWKTHGVLLMEGDCEGMLSALQSCLEWNNQFVAEQVGVPPLQKQHFIECGEGPSDLDHAFHEFSALRAATGKEVAEMPVCGSLGDFIARMHKAAGRWDVRLSPYCDY